MVRKHCIRVAAVGALVLAAWTSMAQEPAKGTGALIKEKAAGAVNSVKKGVTSAKESIVGTYEHARAGAVNMGIHSRVYSRLHWEKALVGAKVETEVTNNGVATLRGTVPDTKAKAKALELANDTIGVTQVIDQLTIAASSEPVPAKSVQP